MKILFAEDTDFWIDFFKSKLENLGEVTCVTNGADAIRQLQQHSFDLIVCDHVMPLVEGHDVYQAARYTERSLNKETPYILFSTLPDEDLYPGFSDDKNAKCILKTCYVDFSIVPDSFKK